MGENYNLKRNYNLMAEALDKVPHLSDVTLSCGKHEFSAHKLVLSMCSTYFKELFTDFMYRFEIFEPYSEA